MSWQSKMRDDIRARNELIGQLRVKLQIALDRLSTISTGMSYREENGPTWSQNEKLMHCAAEGLKQIAEKPERTLW